MSPENLRKLAHLELEISKDNLISVRKWGNEQTDRHTRNLKLFRICAQTSQECLQKIWKKVAHLELEISKDKLIIVRKWDNEQTDRHTRNFEFFGTSVRTSQKCLQKISERYLIKNQRYWLVELVEMDGCTHGRMDPRTNTAVPWADPMGVNWK